MPHSTSASSRTRGNPSGTARPPRIRPNAAWFAALSGTDIVVPSHATNRNPNAHTPGRPATPRQPRTWVNNHANGATPTRRRAFVNADRVGVTPASPGHPDTNCRHTCRYPTAENTAIANTNVTTTRDGNNRTRC